MSLQKGNTSRTRAQKHKNASVFNNSMHDTSRRTKVLNSMEVHGVCQRCKDVIEWKIKYKKYKPLTAPKTCNKCHQKAITGAYRTICKNCASSLKVCEKCGESKGIIVKTILSPEERMKLDADFEKELRCLPERKRRRLLRYMAKARSDPAFDPTKFSEHMKDRISKAKESMDDGLSGDCEDLNVDQNSDDDDVSE